MFQIRRWRQEGVYDQQRLGISWNALLRGGVCWRLETGIYRRHLQLFSIFTAALIIWQFHLNPDETDTRFFVNAEDEMNNKKKAASIKGFCRAPQLFPVNQPSETLSCNISLNGAGVKLYKQDESASHNSSGINHYHDSRLWNNVHQIIRWQQKCWRGWTWSARTAGWSPAITNPASLSSSVSLSPTHCLFLMSCPLPTPFLLFPSSSLTSPWPLWESSDTSFLVICCVCLRVCALTSAPKK